MMACAQAGKSLAYCTFSDDDFAKKALQVFQVLCSSSCTVGKSHLHTLGLYFVFSLVNNRWSGLLRYLFVC